MRLARSRIQAFIGALVAVLRGFTGKITATVALLVAFGVPHASADLIFTDLAVTPTSFSVVISGTLPNPPPDNRGRQRDLLRQ